MLVVFLNVDIDTSVCCATPGVAANLAPALLRSYEEDARIQNEQQLHDKYMSGGLGPHHIGNDEQEVNVSHEPCDAHVSHYTTHFMVLVQYYSVHLV